MEKWEAQAANVLFSAAGRKTSAKINLLRPTFVLGKLPTTAG